MTYAPGVYDSYLAKTPLKFIFHQGYDIVKKESTYLAKTPLKPIFYLAYEIVLLYHAIFIKYYALVVL